MMNLLSSIENRACSYYNTLGAVAKRYKIFGYTPVTHFLLTNNDIRLCIMRGERMPVKYADEEHSLCYNHVIQRKYWKTYLKLNL